MGKGAALVVQRHKSSLAVDDEPWSLRRQIMKTVRKLWTVFVLLLFYVVGVLWFGYSDTEWDWFTSVYFITISVTTVGYGDVVPETDRDKIFVMIYVSIGFSLVGVAMAKAADGFFQQLEEHLQMKKKRRQRALERKASLLGEAFRDEHAVPKDDSDVYRTLYCKKVGYVCLIVALMAVGGIISSVISDWSLVEGVFWAFETSSTIGWVCAGDK